MASTFWTSAWSIFGGSTGGAGRVDRGKQPNYDGVVSLETGRKSDPTISVTADTALRQPAVWACVRVISQTISTMPLKVYTNNPDGSKDEAPDFDLYKLFNHSPNSYQSSSEFIQTLLINLLVWGNAYALISRNSRGEIISLIPLMASQVVVNFDSPNDIYYDYTAVGADLKKRYRQNEIWHVRYMPSNGIMGLSPIAYHAKTITTSDRIGTKTLKDAAGNFRPDAVVSVPTPLSEDVRGEMKARMSKDDDGGPITHILEYGMEYKPVSMTARDAQFIETRRFQVEEIARIFGVPSALINDSSGSTSWGSGISELRDAFYVTALQPLLQNIETSAKRWLVNRSKWNDVTLKFDVKEFLRLNEEARLRVHAEAIRSGITTINEARLAEGKKPVDGGDQPLMQKQYVPLDVLGQEEINVSSTEVGKSVSEDQDGDGTERV